MVGIYSVINITIHIHTHTRNIYYTLYYNQLIEGDRMYYFKIQFLININGDIQKKKIIKLL